MTEHELTITRAFDAPPELVYRAWTDPDQLASWLGPQESVASSVTTDPRPGGRWRACISSPDHRIERWMEGSYRELDPPVRLVAAGVGETLVTITLQGTGDKTEMTFHQAPFPDEVERDGHFDGWRSSFEDLALQLTRIRQEAR
ncbi:SRPBCC family protein [Amycolatopsis sp. NBC_01480]|jgi:uncharacterized protein YndB with AHSA1/START domain|uniref:SRPBCC family protein n=1 Tax=Amycolatopsis sp. NBC_01480 TaxID=2903562 RepID=UPI002E2859F9|nr:SRPBCC domain-containing protein [Amycolatopsis sp. NBC_01480]